MNPDLAHIAQSIPAFGMAHEALVYALIAILALVEGPCLSLILGGLLRLGDFSFWPVYVSLMLGDLTGDVFWYCIGRRYVHPFIKRYGKYFKVTESALDRMAELFHRRKDSVLFLSKISNGFGFALVTLMTAGMIRIPFGRYMLVNFLGQLIWSGLLLGAGFFFSNLYVSINSLFGRLTLIAAGMVIVVLAYRFWKHLRIKGQELVLMGSG